MTSTTMATAERRAVRQRLAAVEALPKGSELERAVLALLHDVMQEAFAARDRGGRDAMTRAYYIGILRAFDALVLDADVEDVRAAFGWAADRIIAMLEAIRAPEPARAG